MQNLELALLFTSFP